MIMELLELVSALCEQLKWLAQGLQGEHETKQNIKVILSNYETTNNG